MTRRSRLISVFDRHARRRDEHGYVLALTALIILPLLLISAMAVDYGGWYSQGARMQRAADAAALAGVVWLPDLATATTVAQSTAKANGYDDALSNITVAVSKLSDYELKVTITDTAGRVYLASWVKNAVTITRTSSAKYVLPVPLGSPRNYFGTGPNVTGSDTYGSKTENFYAAINGYCQSKYQGDPFAVPFINSGNNNTCGAGGNIANGDYIGPASSTYPDQYQYYITVPPSRSQNIVVDIWSPWVDGPADTADATPTFELRAPDNTPLDDSDNPLVTCVTGGQTNPREYTAADNDRTLLGVSGWSDFCTIGTNAATYPAGKYILGIRTKAAESNNAGLNSYSIMASYASSVGTTCDSRSDATCPKVSGKNWISIYANAPGTAKFYLAEIGPEYAGKTLLITLFDPGEGGNSINILDPNGNKVNFVATDEGVDGVTPGTPLASSNSLDVTASRYNGKYVQLSIDLANSYATDFAAATGGYWWKIQYNYSGSVTDRSTWGVKVLGNPVHLTS